MMVSIRSRWGIAAAKRAGVDCRRRPCLIASTRAVENSGMMPPIFRSMRPWSSLKRPNRPSGGEFLHALIDISWINSVDCAPTRNA